MVSTNEFIYMHIKNIKILSYLFCLVLIYTYVYAPAFQIIPFGLDKVILLTSLVFITYKKEWHFVLTKFKSEMILILIISIYSMLVSLLHWKNALTASYDFLLLIQVIPCAFALFRYIEDGKGFRLDLMIINCAVMAALISFYLILNPELSYYFKSVLLKYPDDMIDKFYYRGYGLSDGLLFSYPVIQGFCLSFILLGFAKNKIYFIFIIPILVSIFANARSGLVPIFFGILILFLSNAKNFVKLTISIVLTVVVLLRFINDFLEDNLMLNAAFDWGMSSFDVIGAMFSGEKKENVEVLLDNMIVFPENTHEWIFGSGNYIFTSFLNSTDIGYFLRLNYGGLPYLSLFFLLSILMFLRLRKINLKLALLLFSSLVFLNFKADFFIVNPGSRFFFLVYVICILSRNAFKTKESGIELKNKVVNANLPLRKYI